MEFGAAVMKVEDVSAFHVVIPAAVGPPQQGDQDSRIIIDGESLRKHIRHSFPRVDPYSMETWGLLQGGPSWCQPDLQPSKRVWEY